MALNEIVQKIILDGSGTEIPTLSISSGYNEYYITGTATAIGNYTIVPTGSPRLGTTFVFKYSGTLDITSNSVTFLIFGQALIQSQLNTLSNIVCYYTGSAWEVIVNSSLTDTIIETTNIANLAVTTAKIANVAVDATKLANLAATTAKIDNLAVTTGKIASLAITDAKVNDVDGSKIANASVVGSTKLTNDSVSDAKLATMANSSLKYGDASGDPGNLVLGNDELPIGNGTTVTVISLSSLKDGEDLNESIIIPISFESGEQCLNRIFLRYGATIVQAAYMITKAIAGTDDATLQLKINGVNVGSGAFTIPASTAINSIDSLNPSSAFTVPGGGAYIEAVGTKSTAGGKLILSIMLQRT